MPTLVFCPAQLIKLIDEHAPPIEKERTMGVSPLSPRETICLLVLERLGFEVSPVMRTARLSSSPSSSGDLKVFGIAALRIKSEKWDCIFDRFGHDQEEEILASRADTLVRSSAVKSVLIAAHYDGPWQSIDLDHFARQRLAELDPDPIIDQLVAMCQAHMLQGDTELSSAQVPRRRI